jgi:hypothetical protein
MSSSEDTIVPATALSISHHRSYGHCISLQDFQKFLDQKSRFTGFAGAVITFLNKSGTGGLASREWIGHVCYYPCEKENLSQGLTQELSNQDKASLPARVAGKVLEFDRDGKNRSDVGLVSIGTIRAFTDRSLKAKYADSQPDSTQHDSQQPTVPSLDASPHHPSEPEAVSEDERSVPDQKDLQSIHDVATLANRFLESKRVTIVSLALALEMEEGRQIRRSHHTAMSNNRDPRLGGLINSVFSMNDKYPGRSDCNKLLDAEAAIVAFNKRNAAQNEWVMVSPELFTYLSDHPEVEKRIYTCGEFRGTFNGSCESS